MTTIQDRTEASSWQKKYDALAPRVGDPAPDFTLSDISGKNSLKLSNYQGSKAVALIFGSFT
jgi:peroxiredoxin